MEIASLLPSSDNIYKFLFMGGIFMIAFSFIYPLEKKQRIELEINALKSQMTVQKQELATLKTKIDSLKAQSKPTIAKLENAKKIENLDHSAKVIEDLKTTYNRQYSNILNTTKELSIKNIILEYDAEKIKIMEEHVNSFTVFRFTFLVLGLVSSVFGIYKWIASTNVAERIQKYQLDKLFKETKS